MTISDIRRAAEELCGEIIAANVPPEVKQKACDLCDLLRFIEKAEAAAPKSEVANGR